MGTQDIQLSEHFTLRKLLRFTLPSIVMMIFTSVYSIVDGIFVSNYVGKVPFAAINLIYPFLMICGAVGFMVGTGGSALVAKTLGEGDRDKANGIFTMLVYVMCIAGIVISVVAYVCIRDIALWLGASDMMIDDCVVYSRIILPVMFAFILQYAFQTFMVTAEKPLLGLLLTLAAGIANIVFDYLFIVVFGWGLKGAAYATVIGQCIGGLVPLAYFASPNGSLLRLASVARFDGKALAKACTNGASEFMTQLSMSIVAMLYNFQLMKYIGEDGVAAFGVISYVNFIFVSVFLGYSIGSAPVVSYNLGAGNFAELKNVFRKSLAIIGISGIMLTSLAEITASPLASLFVGYDAGLYDLTCRAIMLYSLAFLLAGFNVYSSSFFTALNNGFVSALISFLRTLVFEAGAVMLIPLLLGINGIWLAIVFAEAAALVVSIAMFYLFRHRYNYV